LAKHVATSNRFTPIDAQVVEIIKLSLMLKALEVETKQKPADTIAPVSRARFA
jgi:hypothetical protein